MTKMKLSLDDLKVESFQTTPEAEGGEQGTVFGYISCHLTICEDCVPTCACNPTQEVSCNGTCGASCGGTCDASCGGTCDATCSGCGGTTCLGPCDTGFACHICTRYNC